MVSYTVTGTGTDGVSIFGKNDKYNYYGRGNGGKGEYRGYPAGGEKVVYCF